MQALRDQALIVVVAASVIFFQLGAARLWDRDEPRNAGCAIEMLERGDWIVPVFNAELRAHKPILLYWLMMSAYGVLGVSEFAARFWSAALGVGTVVITYHVGRRLFDAATARWAAVVLATALMFDVAARAATPDSVLIFCSTL
jgi:4-amino-4-deoxy-L-arabinose transferase-like glycosyltransferase